MKKYLLFLSVYFFCFQKSFAQTGEWVWLHGSSLPNSAGNYGTQGVPSPNNNPQGVYEPCEWTDLNGNFWLYGGRTLNGDLNDLWKYDPLTNQWTWMRGTHSYFDPGNFGVQGISSPLNQPPSKSRAAATWVDTTGNLWVFGGIGPGFIEQSDLWKYDIASNEWTWMKGPSTGAAPGIYGTQGVSDPLNRPVARCEASAAWIDHSNNLWLFGGADNGSFTNLFNDLWKYNIGTNEWTWMKGSSTPNQPGNYGTRGVEDPSNYPGARMSYCRWKDNGGNFWLFGGGSFNDTRNDLWKFNPFTNNWCWMSGDSILNSTGHYGQKCMIDSLNLPRSRYENKTAWTDSKGNLWMFGGGSGGSGLLYQYNDLWMYCISSNRWIWVSGDNLANPAGNWGTLGVSSPTNKPNGRGGGIAWTDHNDHLYFFGGIDYYNDLWMYTIDSSCITCLVLPGALFNATNSICPGACIDFLNLSSNAISYQWNFFDANPDTSTALNPSNICYANPGSYDVQLIATNANGSDTLLLTNYISVFPSPPLQSITQSLDTLFAIQGAASYQWYYDGNMIPGATDYFYVATASGDFNLVATDTNGCEVEAVINDVIASLQLAVPGLQFAIYPNPVKDRFIIHNAGCMMGTAKIDFSIYNMVGEKINLPINLQHQTVDCRALSPGIYFLEIISDNKTYRTKFIKQ